LETGEVKGFIRKTASKNASKSREETFFTQMSVLQNGKFTPNSRF
jgi:hypothetical protein